MYRYSSTLDEDKDRYVAFEGQKFTIEWFFDGKGKSHSLDYFYSE